MLTERFLFNSVGGALMLVGLAILIRQRRATTCPRHSRFAGAAAVVLAVASLVGGAALIGAAWTTHFAG